VALQIQCKNKMQAETRNESARGGEVCVGAECEGEETEMDHFKNIWQHPKTSLAGVLIAAATIAGVLMQQGVSLGTLGNGSVVSLVSALSAAFLGLLAKDPDSKTDSRADKGAGTARLGAWMLIAFLLAGTLPTVGCTEQSVAQNIVNWTPSLQSAVAAVDSVAATLAPADAAASNLATASMDAVSNLLVGQAQAYLAAPTATTLRQLQDQVVALQQQVNTALLAVVKITNPSSQQQVLSTVQAVATIVTAILSLIQSVSTQSDIQRMAAQSAVKVAEVQPLLNEDSAARIVAAHYDEPLPVAQAQVAQVQLEMARAGF